MAGETADPAGDRPVAPIPRVTSPSSRMSAEIASVDPLERYSRQVRFSKLGETGQQRLQTSRVAVFGCGALGSVSAQHLVRAGVGFVRVIDRDIIETHNLQRQLLYDEDDVASGLPKAAAAARKLSRINSAVAVEPVVADIDQQNIRDLMADVDIVVDGTDNFETRYLTNDAAVALGKPWVFGGVIGSEGQTMTIVPGRTPCLRCVFESAPPPGSAPTCETAGVLAPAVAVVASFQAVEAIKYLAGAHDALNPDLILIDLWDWSIRRLGISSLSTDRDCPCCHHHQYDWLDGNQGTRTVTLCGRNAVQMGSCRGERVNFAELAARLAGSSQVTFNAYLLRFSVEGFEFTVFPDGRAIIKGTPDVARARTLYARYVGS